MLIDKDKHKDYNYHKQINNNKNNKFQNKKNKIK